ncbi:hypothetical protein A3194_19105 [Candidatus Thiodiazotropha endoloripes]|uniref:DEAD/DEAH box helicase n=1 Tax=Candidatus Thiodiazotropha endoloripes TaxID=1818881 RepID=UPI00083E0DD9|nr:DEAD/DEAH box helicase [Candidatus Thiodiazotropha endoloripes]ODB82366.1 hypothetical protein A3194_19105 [Candidatus Thiodiazotropha endoloripes]
MAVYATFVGVNTHADDRVKELTGAVADATAFWALFKDSIPEMQFNLLLNEAATTSNIKASFQSHLSDISQDDTLLFFFAGHGSPDHHLVTYDTSRDDISGTSIPMDELSAWLNGDQARTVVFLDCCFSGGATARVLQDVPVSRSGMVTISDLQGNGRVIVTASQSDQPALEINGHGLFSKALLETFFESEDGISIGFLTDEVTRKVRAEAERLGGGQRPVVFNHIEDGFTFPPLAPGVLYAEHFPDTSGLTVSSDIKDLTAYGLPESLIEIWSEQFSGGVNSLQLSAINDHRVLDGKSLLTVAPTSSGKTFIGELAIARAISEGRKAVFLLPYRALTNEKYEDFNAIYGDQLGYRVIRCTGDYSDETETYMRGQYDIALFTYEMFLNLSLSAQETLYQLGLVVIDEAQFITDEARGINVELLITYLLLQREQGVCPQIVALSAVIGDVNYFNEWLACEVQISNQRPIPLVEGVIDRSGLFQYIDTDGEEKTDQLVPIHQIVQRGNKASSQDVIVPLVQNLIADEETVLVFRNNRGSTVGAANYLAKALGLPPASEAIQNLSRFDQSVSTEKLISAMNGGACFHNSDLNRDERMVVEAEFKKIDGKLKVMSATTTVAAGVNTPASTAIIAECFFYGDGGKKDFSVAEYKNMAGRAGRFGISDRGRSVLLAETPSSRAHLFEKYVRGTPEPIHSSFDVREIDTWVLRLLSQVAAVPRKDAIHLLANTFGGYLANRENPNWVQDTEKKLTLTLKKMLQLNLVDEYDDTIELTLLGKACGRSSLSFPSSMQLVEIIQNHSQQLTAMKLVGLIQVLPEVSRYTPIMKRGTKEHQWAGEVSRIYGRDITAILQRRASDSWEYHARCKRAAIINQWVCGTPLDQIEQQYSANPFQGTVGAGDVRGFADVTRLYLRAANEIAGIVLLGEGPDSLEVDDMLKRLEIGLSAEALPLMELPVSLSRGEYLNLYNSGFVETEAVLGLSKEEMLQYVTSTNVELLKKQLENEAV